MDVSALLGISLASWALLSFWILPIRARAIRASPTPDSLSSAATYAALDVLRLMAAVSATVGIVFVLAVWTLQLTDAASPERVANAMARLRTWKAAMSSVSPIWSGLVLAASGLGVILLVRRRMRLRVHEALQRAFEREFSRVADLFNRGETDDLPRSEQMEAIDAELAKGRRYLVELEAQTTDEAAQARRRIEEALKKLVEQRVFADMRRRMDLRIDPDTVLDPPPVSVWERVRLLFVSRGLVATLRGGNRVMSAVTVGLLIASLVGVNAGSSAASADHGLVRLTDLQLTLNAAAAEREWQEARSGLTGAGAPEALDDQTLDAISAVFENSFVDQAAWSAIPRSAVSLRAQVTRQAVLKTAAARAGSSVDLAAGLDAAPDATPVERGVLHDVDTTFHTAGPRTEIGRQFRQDLRQVVSQTPGLGRRLRDAAAEAVHAFQQRAATDEFSRLFVGRLLGVGLDQAADTDPAIVELAQQLDRNLGPDRRTQLYRSKAQEFLTSLAKGESVEQAAAKVAAHGRVFWSPSEVNTFANYVTDHAGAQTLETHPPALVAKDAPGLASDHARQIVEQLERPGRMNAEALSTFDDYFPAQQGRDLQTPRGQLIHAAEEASHQGTEFRLPGVAGGGGFGSPARRPATPRPSMASGPRVAFARARSFTALRGFSRIGGVLIGNLPATSPNLNFKNLSWSRTETGMMFRLSRSDGREFTLGPYRESIVNQALVYAADGRPVTATMVTAEPLFELKILLHPALLDSPLGCRAIEIDRLVDTYAGSERSERTQQEREIRQHHALYQLAWAERVDALIPDLLTRVNASDRNALMAVRGLAARLRESTAIKTMSAAAITARARLADPERSILGTKDAYYDKRLVGDLRLCAARGSVEAFTTCIRSTSVDRSSMLLNGESDWLTPPPTFIFWSGVRENEYTLDPDLNFLTRPTGDGVSQRLWPFQFMLQVAFTSAPGFVAGDAAAYSDEKPFEFPALRAWIMTEVDHRMTSAHRAVVADMADFAVLQRLFRVALGERLGPAFPVQTLTALAKATAPSVKADRTLRWNPRPGAIERVLTEELEARLSAVNLASTSPSPAAVAPVQACINSLASATGGYRSAAPAWPAECTRAVLGPSAISITGRSSWATEVGDLIDQFQKTHQLRKSLGVALDDAQAKQRNGCGAI